MFVDIGNSLIDIDTSNPVAVFEDGICNLYVVLTSNRVDAMLENLGYRP